MALSVAPNPVHELRTRLGDFLFERVAGSDGPEKRDRIHFAPGERRYAPGDAIRIVHGDASMFVGGIRALLLQSLHPLAMAAVDQHSGYRGDPWGRLQRTSTFIAETTFGRLEDADRAVAIVRAVHKRIDGEYEGVAYRASDPHLLRWVHVAEVDSFLRAHDVYGSQRLSPSQRDEYVAQAAHTGIALGAERVPESAAELRAAIEEFRPELRSTPAARRTARFLLVHPPVPLLMRGPYGLLTSAGVGLLPRWARLPLRLPYLPPVEATAGRAAGELMTRSIRWVLPRAEPN